MDVYNLKEMWGALVFRGVVAILFGIAAVFWPGLTLVTLVYLFGGYILATGLINMVVGLTNFNDVGSFWGRLFLMIVGLVELGAGVYLLRHPLVSFATLILVIGLTFIVRGVFELFAGIFGAGSALYKTVLVLGGALAVVVGVLMLMQPAASGVAFVWLLGLYALITGTMLVALAFEAKNAIKPRPRPAR